MAVRNIYLYVKKQFTKNCLKYGMKLSEYSNILIKKDNTLTKKGIQAYFTPRDCSLYDNTDYTILRISVNEDNLKIMTFNNIDKKVLAEIDSLKKDILNIPSTIPVLNTIKDKIESKKNNNSNFIPLKEYILGTFEYPEIIISSSILPENISIYNKILDVPLLFTTSNELYNQKKEETFIQENLNMVTYNDIINK